MKNLDVVSLVSEDQQFRSKRNVPKFEPQHVTAWSGDKPRLAVDEKGVPVVLCVPNWLRKQAHVSFSRRHLDAGMTEVLTLKDILFNLLREFGVAVGVQVKANAADKASRDKLAGYTRLHEASDELHGVFQLVALWRSMSRGQVRTRRSRCDIR